MGFFLVLLTAGSQATNDLFFSSTTLKELPALFRAWLISAAALPFLIVLVAIFGIPEIAPAFWKLLAVQVVLISVARVLYMRALSLGPVSQTQPILALTPVFLIVTTPLMTNDVVTPLGWMGVMLVACGIYGVQHPGSGGLLAPFKEALSQPGVKSKFGVALIFAVTSNIDRLGMAASSGTFYLLTTTTGVTVALGVVLLVQRWFGHAPRIVYPRVTTLAASGSIHGLTIVLHIWALQFLSVPYVIAIKRLSIVLVSLWGYLVRKERRPHWYRLLGLAAVSAGIMFIVLFGKG